MHATRCLPSIPLTTHTVDKADGTELQVRMGLAISLSCRDISKLANNSFFELYHSEGTHRLSGETKKSPKS